MSQTVATLRAKLKHIVAARVVQASHATKPATTAAGKAAKAAAKKALRTLIAQQKEVNKQIRARQIFESEAKSKATPADKSRKAKAPGRRVSKSGKVYYESRTNRADASGKTHI
jgi:hypothetical protein